VFVYYVNTLAVRGKRAAAIQKLLFTRAAAADFFANDLLERKKLKTR